MSLPEDEVAAAWSAYWDDRSDHQALEVLLRAYAHLAGYYARMALAKAPTYQDRDDIHAYAQQGLLQAIERYSPDRGAKFETWAARTIPNRIKDRQRTDDPLTRAMRGNVKLLEAAQEALWRPSSYPTLEELADHMQMSIEEVRAVLLASQSQNAELDTSTGHTTDSDAEVLVRMAEARAYVANRLADLGPRQRAFTLVYYCDTDPDEPADKTLTQACRELGISSDWARQTRHQVLDGLRR